MPCFTYKFCYNNYRSTIGVLEITIVIVSEVFQIPIVIVLFIPETPAPT